MKKLKPCPFCHCPEDLLIEESGGVVETRIGNYQHGWIECSVCGAQGPYVKMEDTGGFDYEAIRYAWNNRVTL